MTTAPSPSPVFREHLRPGPAGWGAVVLIAVFSFIALLPLQPVAAAVAGLVVATGGIWVLVGSAPWVEVTDTELRAGRAHIGLGFLADAQPLDEAGTRQALGPGLDARAFVCQRGWVHTAVRIDLADPDDPTPYWIVSSRDPARLAQALRSVMAPRH